MRVLLTGGGGFLGGATARRLREAGHEVRSFSRGRYPALEALGVEHVQGDLADTEAVTRAARGCDAVVHTAAKAGVWGAFEDYWRANVLGTRSVIAACRAASITRLVHTSSPAVVHDGDVHGGDESMPYVSRFHSHYQETKTLSEREALGARGEGLAVTALRPHLIWGPGDPHMAPRILARIRGGRIALPRGGAGLIDTLYVDNGADALLHALERLEPGAPCDGRAYFITNGEPRTTARMVCDIAAALGRPARPVAIPMPVARAAGAALESAFTWARTRREPPFTRFSVEQIGGTHYFDIGAAARDLAWTPRVSIDEGLARLAARRA